MTTVIPRDPRAAERVPQRTIQAIANRYLVAIGAALIPEPFNVNDNDGPVNGQPPVLHLSPTRENKAEAKLSLAPSLTRDNAVTLA